MTVPPVSQDSPRTVHGRGEDRAWTVPATGSYQVVAGVATTPIPTRSESPGRPRTLFKVGARAGQTVITPAPDPPGWVTTRASLWSGLMP